MTTPYTPEMLTREAVDQLPGATVLDFGTNWCGYCQTAEPIVDALMAERVNLNHVKVEDGKGCPLGRSYGIKQWPTLVFLANGQEITRIVRPTDKQEIADALEQITAAV